MYEGWRKEDLVITVPLILGSTMKYVLGFLFSPEGDRVVLIRKSKPAWQKGRLNGVGGKVEPKEKFYQAMVREFSEETGLLVENWKPFGSMYSVDAGWEVILFAGSSIQVDEVKTATDEEVVVLPVSEAVQLTSKEAISNVSWLVASARDCLLSPAGFKEMAVEY